MSQCFVSAAYCFDTDSWMPRRTYISLKPIPLIPRSSLLRKRGVGESLERELADPGSRTVSGGNGIGTSLIAELVCHWSNFTVL